MKKVRSLAPREEVVCARFAFLLACTMVIAMAALEVVVLLHTKAMSPDTLLCAGLCGSGLWGAFVLASLSKLVRDGHRSIGIQIVISVVTIGFTISVSGLFSTNPSMCSLLVNVIPASMLAWVSVKGFWSDWEKCKFKKNQ